MKIIEKSVTHRKQNWSNAKPEQKKKVFRFLWKTFFSYKITDKHGHSICEQQTLDFIWKKILKVFVAVFDERFHDCWNYYKIHYKLYHI